MIKLSNSHWWDSAIFQYTIYYLKKKTKGGKADWKTQQQGEQTEGRIQESQGAILTAD